MPSMLQIGTFSKKSSTSSPSSRYTMAADEGDEDHSVVMGLHSQMYYHRTPMHDSDGSDDDVMVMASSRGPASPSQTVRSMYYHHPPRPSCPSTTTTRPLTRSKTDPIAPVLPSKHTMASRLFHAQSLATVPIDVGNRSMHCGRAQNVQTPQSQMTMTAAYQQQMARKHVYSRSLQAPQIPVRGVAHLQPPLRPMVYSQSYSVTPPGFNPAVSHTAYSKAFSERFSCAESPTTNQEHGVNDQERSMEMEMGMEMETVMRSVSPPPGVPGTPGVPEIPGIPGVSAPDSMMSVLTAVTPSTAPSARHQRHSMHSDVFSTEIDTEPDQNESGQSTAFSAECTDEEVEDEDYDEDGDGDEYEDENEDEDSECSECSEYSKTSGTVSSRMTRRTLITEETVDSAPSPPTTERVRSAVSPGSSVSISDDGTLLSRITYEGTPNALSIQMDVLDADIMDNLESQRVKGISAEIDAMEHKLQSDSHRPQNDGARKSVDMMNTADFEMSLDSTPSPRSIRSDTGSTDSVMRQLVEREEHRETVRESVSVGSGKVDSLLVRLIVGDGHHSEIETSGSCGYVD